MSTPDLTRETPQEQLISIRQEIQRLTSQEVSMREKRNTAVRVAVAQRIPVMHLARNAGVSREILHRILRAGPQLMPESDSAAVEALANLLDLQGSLTAISVKRSHAEKHRAVTIRKAVALQENTRTDIASWAGVSSETVRKVCIASGQDPQGIASAGSKTTIQSQKNRH